MKTLFFDKNDPKPLFAQLPGERTIASFTLKLISPDSNCGFTILGVSRTEFVDSLLEVSGIEHSREGLFQEIYEAFSSDESIRTEEWNGYYQSRNDYQVEFDEKYRTIRDERMDESTYAFTPEETIGWLKEHCYDQNANELIRLKEQVEQAEGELYNYCTTEGVYKYYLNLLKSTSLFLGIKSALLYAKLHSTSLYILRHVENYPRLECSHYYQALNPQNKIYMLHTSGDTHFDQLLRRTNFDLSLRVNSSPTNTSHWLELFDVKELVIYISHYLTEQELIEFRKTHHQLFNVPLSLHKDTTFFRQRLVNIYLAKGMDYLQKFLESHYSDDFPKQAFITAVYIIEYGLVHLFDDATVILETLSENEKAKPYAAYHLAKLFYERGDNQRAKQYMQIAEQAGNPHALLLTNLRKENKLEQFKEALKRLNEPLENHERERYQLLLNQAPDLLTLFASIHGRKLLNEYLAGFSVSDLQDIGEPMLEVFASFHGLKLLEKLLEKFTSINEIKQGFKKEPLNNLELAKLANRYGLQLLQKFSFKQLASFKFDLADLATDTGLQLAMKASSSFQALKKMDAQRMRLIARSRYADAVLKYLSIDDINKLNVYQLHVLLSNKGWDIFNYFTVNDILILPEEVLEAFLAEGSEYSVKKLSAEQLLQISPMILRLLNREIGELMAHENLADFANLQLLSNDLQKLSYALQRSSSNDLNLNLHGRLGICMLMLAQVFFHGRNSEAQEIAANEERAWLYLQQAVSLLCLDNDEFDLKDIIEKNERINLQLISSVDAYKLLQRCTIERVLNLNKEVLQILITVEAWDILDTYDIDTILSLSATDLEFLITETAGTLLENFTWDEILDKIRILKKLIEDEDFLVAVEKLGECCEDARLQQFLDRYIQRKNNVHSISEGSSAEDNSPGSDDSDGNQYGFYH